MRLFDMDSKEDYLLDGRYMVATPHAPCVDVVEVVRCRDCFLYGGCEAAKWYGDDGYCSVGDRRKDDESDNHT